eukprot:1193212-Prorocentrum_minimum.AAC.9
MGLGLRYKQGQLCPFCDGVDAQHSAVLPTAWREEPGWPWCASCWWRQKTPSRLLSTVTKLAFDTMLMSVPANFPKREHHSSTEGPTVQRGDATRRGLPHRYKR